MSASLLKCRLEQVCPSPAQFSTFSTASLTRLCKSLLGSGFAARVLTDVRALLVRRCPIGWITATIRSILASPAHRALFTGCADRRWAGPMKAWDGRGKWKIDSWIALVLTSRWQFDRSTRSDTTRALEWWQGAGRQRHRGLTDSCHRRRHSTHTGTQELIVFV